MSSSSWRDNVAVHPTADLFPMISDAELRELANDIKAHGLQERIKVIFKDGKYILIDGRNRLAAMELLRTAAFYRDGEPDPNMVEVVDLVSLELDPATYIISANVRRRHLNGAQKRDLIGKLLELNPSKSDRQIAAVVGVNHKTVGPVRNEKVGRGEIPHADKRIDSRGRQQPASKPKSAPTKIKSPPEKKPKDTKSNPVADAIAPREACVMAVREMILNEWLPQIPQVQWTQFVVELYDEIDSIKGVIEKRTGPIRIKPPGALPVVATETTAKANTAAPIEMPDLPACLDRQVKAKGA